MNFSRNFTKFCSSEISIGLSLVAALFSPSTPREFLFQVINAVFANMERVGNTKDDTVIVSEVVEHLVSSAVALAAESVSVPSRALLHWNVSTSFQCEDSETRSVRGAGASSTIWGENEGNHPEDHLSFPNVEQKDAFLVFRALCVLAQKEEGDVNDPR